MQRFLVLLGLLWCLSGIANGQQFAFGASLGGVGTFGTGVLGTGLPDAVVIAARAEWLDGLAKGLSVRLDAGTQVLSLGVTWRFDLSQQVNFMLSAALAWLEQGAGLIGRIGVEYRFLGLGVSLEYGLISPFVGTPNLRSNLLFGVIYFLGG